MPTVLESASLVVFHASPDYINSGSFGGDLYHTYPSTPVTGIVTSPVRFGSYALDLYSTYDYASVRGIPGSCPIQLDSYTTVSTWAYYRSHLTGSSHRGLIGAESGSHMFGIRTGTTGVLSVHARDNYGVLNLSTSVSGTPAPLNTWLHLAATMDSWGVRRLYQDGVLIACGTAISGTQLSSSNNSFFLLGPATGGTASLPNAVVDDALCVVGYNVYEPTFIPPSVPFPEGAADPHFAQVSLLLHANEAHGSTAIVDSSPNALVAVSHGGGTVLHSDARYKSGSTSLLFGGTAALRYASSSLFEIASRDWTAECYVNLSEASTNQPHIFEFYGASNSFRLNLSFLTSTRRFSVFGGNGSPVHLIQTGSMTAGSWVHVALTKQGAFLHLWVGGVLAGSVQSPVLPTGPLTLSIGAPNFDNTSNWMLNGYLDEVRLTMGVSRYPVGFVPPTTALADPTPGELIGGIVPKTLTYLDIALGLADHKFDPLGWRKKDYYYGGSGKIVGYTKEQALPSATKYAPRRILLLRERENAIIAETWSNPETGYYEFQGLSMTAKYTLVAYDHTNTYAAEVATGVTPEPMS